MQFWMAGMSLAHVLTSCLRGERLSLPSMGQARSISPLWSLQQLLSHPLASPGARIKERRSVPGKKEKKKRKRGEEKIRRKKSQNKLKKTQAKYLHVSDSENKLCKA